MMHPILRRVAACLAVLLMIACNDSDRVAGGWTDTDTGTKVSGLIQTEGGGAAAGARVALRPADFLAQNPAQPDSSGPRTRAIRDGWCDPEGRFVFDSVPAGQYLVEARLDGRGTLIPFEADSLTEAMELASERLGPLGNIRGRVLFSDGEPGKSLVRVYGMERAVLADPATGAFQVDSMPGGMAALHASGLEPFILPVKKPGIAVPSGASADAGDIILQRKLKQAFRITDGYLDIPGVDSTNPVIFENGAFQNPVDGAYLWAKASLGHLNLRGTIVTYGKDTGEAAVQANLQRCMALAQSARASGMKAVLDPVAGARYKLAAAPSGRLEDIEPIPTQGGLLLIQEAYRARADKPLIVISGAGMTTVAEALLRDPAIANRMVVFSANSGNVNNSDSLAAAVVAKKARLVQWARDYYWDNSGFAQKSAELFPTNRLGGQLRKQLHLAGTGQYWAYAFFADFGAATYLFNKKIWRSARPGNLKVAASKTDAASEPLGSGQGKIHLPDEPFDYVDIPKEANDWNAMQEEFYATVTAPGAYHAWAVPGPVAGGAFMSNLRVEPAGDPAAPGVGATLTGRGSWAEYALQSEAAGTCVLTLRVRSDVPAGIRVTGSAADLDTSVSILPTVEVVTHTADIRLEAGLNILRIESTRSALTLEGIHIDPVRP